MPRRAIERLPRHDRLGDAFAGLQAADDQAAGSRGARGRGARTRGRSPGWASGSNCRSTRPRSPGEDGAGAAPCSRSARSAALFRNAYVAWRACVARDVTTRRTADIPKKSNRSSRLSAPMSTTTRRCPNRRAPGRAPAAVAPGPTAARRPQRTATDAGSGRVSVAPARPGGRAFVRATLATRRQATSRRTGRAGAATESPDRRPPRAAQDPAIAAARLETTSCADPGSAAPTATMVGINRRRAAGATAPSSIRTRRAVGRGGRHAPLRAWSGLAFGHISGLPLTISRRLPGQLKHWRSKPMGRACPPLHMPWCLGRARGRTGADPERATCALDGRTGCQPARRFPDDASPARGRVHPGRLDADAVQQERGREAAGDGTDDAGREASPAAISPPARPRPTSGSRAPIDRSRTCSGASALIDWRRARRKGETLAGWGRARSYPGTRCARRTWPASLTAARCRGARPLVWRFVAARRRGPRGRLDRPRRSHPRRSTRTPACCAPRRACRWPRSIGCSCRAAGSFPSRRERSS